MSLLATLIIGWSGFEIPAVLVVLNVVLLLTGAGYVIVKQNLFAYVTKRVGEAVFTIFVISTITFLALRLIPGGPFDSEKALPAEVIANIEAKYKLNAPIYVQYADYMGGLLRLDLGESYKYIGRPITSIIADSFPTSLQLGLYALLVSFLVGIPLGVIAAANHNKWQDSTAMGFAISGVSLPSFVMAQVMILIFSYKLGWLPPALWEGPEYYLMPVLILGIRPAAVIARLTRSSVLDVIRSDFVRTAYAKGVEQRVVLFKHVLRNSLIPVVTVAGPLTATILTGSFVIELIFAVPGMAKHVIQAVTNRDYPLIMGVTLLYSTILVLANLIVDMLYVVIDPRIKLS